eukprot:Gregarina_sp_Poly_1__10127@NODE_690_length_6749_cov_8_016761_g520_i0_p5_GENE_NODE_690_length_6749_cov_8_016761_g520_i0NODE_690_length_6749_cov_8_016761_g520_i0_p5_ORF_typecomplete_len140_score16_02_NODE_690_length_6749_cov_8_016761_g520_i042754694
MQAGWGRVFSVCCLLNTLVNARLFDGCDAPKKLQIDIALSDFLNDCFVPRGRSGFASLLAEIEDAYPGSVFSVHRFSDFHRQGACFYTFTAQASAKDAARVLDDHWSSSDCNRNAIVTDAQIIAEHGSITNFADARLSE